MRPVMMLVGGLSIVAVAAAAAQATPVRPSVAGFSPAQAAGSKIGSTGRAGAALAHRSKLGGDGLVGVVLAGVVGGGIGYAGYELIRNHHGDTHDAFSVSP